MSIADTLVASLAAFRNANRIDGTRASYRKDNPSEYAAVMAYLDGSPRPTGTLTLMGQGLVLEEDARRALVAPPPPPPTGTPLDSISDFTGPTLHPTQIAEITTPYGPGFRFNHSHTGGSGNGVQLQDWDHFVKRDGSHLGTTNEFTGRFMFPSEGNPDGFADFWDFNVLWEYGPGHTWNNQFGINGVLNKIYVRSYKSGVPDSRQKAEQSGTVQYDHWYRFVWRVKWSEGSDGAVFFKLDDEVVANWTGPTQPPGNTPPWIQWGYYTDLSVGNISGNIIEYAQLRKV